MSLKLNLFAIQCPAQVKKSHLEPNFSRNTWRWHGQWSLRKSVKLAIWKNWCVQPHLMWREVNVVGILECRVFSPNMFLVFAKTCVSVYSERHLMFVYNKCHLIFTLVKLIQKLDQVNCANIWSWTLGRFLQDFFGGQFLMETFWWKIFGGKIVSTNSGQKQTFFSFNKPNKQ